MDNIFNFLFWGLLFGIGMMLLIFWGIDGMDLIDENPRILVVGAVIGIIVGLGWFFEANKH